jgi:Fe-S cluster assembly protein SufD
MRLQAQKIKCKNQNKKRDKLIVLADMFGKKEIIVEDKEKITILIVKINSSNFVSELTIDIAGKDTDVKILGLIIGAGNETLKLKTNQIHKSSGSMSNLLIRSVMFGKSRFDFEGLIKIEKNAQNSNAYQKNENILMSDNAWIESKPFLEIKANDVKCTHGVTMGKIDSEKIYYLKTRGISQKEGEMLILEGFIKDILDRIPDNKIAESIMEKAKIRLEELIKKQFN